MKIISFLLFSFIFCLAVNATDKEQPNKTGKVVNSSTMHEFPRYKSPVISELAENDSVVISQRKRAWYQIKADKDNLTGWIKMLNVRFTGVLKRQGELGVKNLFDSIITKQVNPTASTGIRGFDEEDLKNAKADLAQLAFLSTYQVTSEDVKTFALMGELQSNNKVLIDVDSIKTKEDL